MNPFLTPTAYSVFNRSSAVGNERDKIQENDRECNCLNNWKLEIEIDPLSTFGMGKEEMGRSGIEPPTHGFSVRCSTN
jgi:hypothetical protein